MGLLLFTVAFVTPLLILPGASFYFDISPKIVVVLVAAAVMLPWRFPQAVATMWAGSRSRWFVILLGAHVVSLLISTALSADPMMSIGGTNWRRFGVLTQIAMCVVAVGIAAFPGTHRHVVLATASAGALAGLYGILQYFGWDPWVPQAGYHAGEGVRMIVRPPSTLGHAGYAAAFFLHAAFGGVAVVANRRDRLRAIGWAAAIICPIAIVLSGTRASLLGLVVGAVWLAWLFRAQISKRYAAIAVTTGVFVCVAFLMSPAGEGIRRRLLWVMEEPTGGARPALWRDTLRLGWDRVITGWGPETFSMVFPHYQSVELSRAFPDFYHESAHNMFLTAFAEQGLIGLAILAALCVLGLRSPANPILRASLLGLIVSQQFTTFTLPIALCLFTTIALLTPANETFTEAGGPRALRLAMAIPALALLMYAASIFVWDRSLYETRLVIGSGRVVPAPTGVWTPPGGSADLWYSRTMLQFATRSKMLLDRAQAIQLAYLAGTRATERAEERASAWYNLALVCAFREDPVAIESALRRAIAASPNWFKPHWTLAELLDRTGRKGEAQVEAAKALDLSGGKHPEVRATVDRLRLDAR